MCTERVYKRDGDDYDNGENITNNNSSNVVLVDPRHGSNHHSGSVPTASHLSPCYYAANLFNATLSTYSRFICVFFPRGSFRHYSVNHLPS